MVSLESVYFVMQWEHFGLEKDPMPKHLRRAWRLIPICFIDSFCFHREVCLGKNCTS
ncbi:hypothetical protein Hdeb2414_s0430g00892001 [Helianthus debilis subsp. tardiflorus]